MSPKTTALPTTPPTVMVAHTQEYEATRATILRQLHQLDELSTERGILNEQAKNVLVNDDEFGDLDDKAKEARRSATLRKKSLMMTDASVKLKQKITDKNAEIKEIKDDLSINLVAYQKMTGVSVIEDEDGVERQFSLSAKIKPKQLDLFPKEGV